MRLFEGWTTTSALDCGDDRSARSPIDAVLAAIGSEMLGVGATAMRAPLQVDLEGQAPRQRFTMP